MRTPTLLAVPNVSEGRDRELLAALSGAFAGMPTDGEAALAPADGTHSGLRLLDVHSDRDHHRAVFTLAGHPGELADALLCGARLAVERIDVVTRADASAEVTGQHPHVGAVDVVPIVYLDPADRGAACAEALVVGDRIAEELHVPVFIYGELSGADPGSAQTRAQLRRGGVLALGTRIAKDIHPDFGPPRLHPTAGATLVAARPPLVAFNLQLAPPATVEDARAIAARVREGGADGLPGLRAIGVQLSGGVAQVSMNIERPFELPLATVVEAVGAHAELTGAELVGLAPAAALAGFPHELPLVGFDPARQMIENALGC